MSKTRNTQQSIIAQQDDNMLIIAKKMSEVVSKYKKDKVKYLKEHNAHFLWKRYNVTILNKHLDDVIGKLENLIDTEENSDAFAFRYYQDISPLLSCTHKNIDTHDDWWNFLYHQVFRIELNMVYCDYKSGIIPKQTAKRITAQTVIEIEEVSEQNEAYLQENENILSQTTDKASELETEAANLRQQVTNLQKEQETNIAELASSSSLTAKLQTEMTLLKARLFLCKSELKESQKLLSEKEQELENEKSLNKAKQKRIEELEQEITTVRKANDKLAERLLSTEEKLHKITEQYNSQSQLIKSLEDRVVTLETDKGILSKDNPQLVEIISDLREEFKKQIATMQEEINGFKGPLSVASTSKKFVSQDRPAQER